MQQNATSQFVSIFNVFSVNLLPCLFIMITYLYVDFHFSPRSVSGLDKEPDLVHMEAHTPDGSECPEHIIAIRSRNKQGLIRIKILNPQGQGTGLPSW